MEGTSYLRTPEAMLPLYENPMVKDTPQISKDYLADFEAEALPYSNDLYRTALRLLRQPAKASDAVQETYLLAWKSFDRYQRGDKL